jgi:hypothetical protein
MATPLHHAQASVNRWGGTVDDYLFIHNWFDETKAFHPDFRHRAIRHHSQGVQECIKKYGDYIELNNNKKVPIKLIAEQHLIEDCGYIPSMSDWLMHIKPQMFMYKAQKLSNKMKKILFLALLYSTSTQNYVITSYEKYQVMYPKLFDIEAAIQYKKKVL